MNNFYLTLLSDSSLSTFSKNTQCDFKVKLDHSIQIEKDNWEVGLVEVITPTEVNNITKENNYVILRFTDRKMCEDIDNCTKYVSYVDQKIYIQNGYYASPRHLVEEIQKSINFRYGLTLKNSNATITISYGENSARVKLDVQDPTKVQIIFPKAIAEILGVDRNYFDKSVGNEKYIFRYGVDLNTKIHQLYIYSDLASYTFIGDVTAPILRVLPFESKRENNHLHQEFVNVHYVPVAKSFIDQVHISIKGDTGEKCAIYLWENVSETTFSTERIMLKQSRSIISLQSGKGDFPVYRGVSRQYGNGLGSIFKAALRTVIPILKPVAKASLKSVKKVAKDQGVQALKDIVGGENVKKVLKQRGKTALKSIGQSTINQLAINSTQKRKKPQSQSRHRTVKRGFKSRAKKFNPIKRLVFEKDIFDEK